MKFYVTGRSSNILEVKRVTALITAKGHEITFDWPNSPMIKPYADNQGKAVDFAQAAITGIVEADVYILIAHFDGTGVFAELGAALGPAQLHGKPRIYGVASEIPQAMFHYHPAIIWNESITDVFSDLGI